MWRKEESEWAHNTMGAIIPDVAGGAKEEVSVLDERGAGGSGGNSEGYAGALLLRELHPHPGQILFRLAVVLLTLNTSR
jgi:hypothetical protein